MPRTYRLKNRRLDRYLCQCGCGEFFYRVHTTRPPQYVNAAHRQRAYRQRVNTCR